MSAMSGGRTVGCTGGQEARVQVMYIDDARWRFGICRTINRVMAYHDGALVKGVHL